MRIAPPAVNRSSVAASIINSQKSLLQSTSTGSYQLSQTGCAAFRVISRYATATRRRFKTTFVLSLGLPLTIHYILLHFALVADDAKCIVVTSVCVCVSVCLCLSLAACPHYCTDPDVTWGNGRGARSCALLGGFAIGVRLSLLWQHSPNAKCQRMLVLALCLVFEIGLTWPQMTLNNASGQMW